MYPFKCYYNACFFCTINHGNEAYFPHQNKQELCKYVDTVLDFIENESIGNVNFIDEAIYPDALVYFMEKVLERKLKFVYRFRARFEKLFLDSEIVKKLYITGARYIGIGLESASPRVNAFVNK